MKASSFAQPVSIAVAPNGGRRTKVDHPAISLTASELARTAAECLEAGASMIHVHVRKHDGGHLLDAEAYRDAIHAIRGEIGDRMVVQITSEALGIYSPAEQRAVIRDVRPEAASLALRELVPHPSEEGAFAELLRWMAAEGVTPQIILYSPDDAVRLDSLRQRGLLPAETLSVLYVLGRYTPDQTSIPSDLLPFLVPQQPAFRPWSVCAFGQHETACVVAAALMGGHVRVGFENNLMRADGSLARNNAERVAEVVQSCRALGLTVAVVDDTKPEF